MKIVSGRTGSPHVTSQQFRQMLEGILGQDSYILTSGENLKPELSSNNLLKIRSGMMCHHGCISCVEIGTYDEVTLTNGSHGMQRIDLVVNRYTRNAETEVEKCEWKVITGTAKASSPAVPTYTKSNLQEGDLVDECPVFEIHYNGINVTEVKSLLSVVGSLAELNGKSIVDFGSNYMKYGNGLLIQWGTATFPGEASGGKGFATINFPKTFANTSYTLIATAKYPGSTLPAFLISTDVNSASKAYVYARTTSMSAVTGAGCSWLAIGQWK